jgi:hypothetical protein
LSFRDGPRFVAAFQNIVMVDRRLAFRERRDAGVT